MSTIGVMHHNHPETSLLVAGRSARRCPSPTSLCRGAGLSAVAVLLGCAPDFRAPDGLEPPRGTVTMTIEPDAVAVAAPIVMRAHLWPDPLGGVAPALLAEDLVLVEGALSSAQRRQLAGGEWSQSLEERVVPTLRWSEADGHVVLAPARPLALGTTYTVANSSDGWVEEITTRTDDPTPMLERLWPPAGAEGLMAAAVWCGGELLPSFAIPGALAPNGPDGSFRSGPPFGASGMESSVPHRCVWFEPAGGPVTRDSAGVESSPEEAQAQESEPGWVAPPAVAVAGSAAVAYLDPVPIRLGPPATSPGPLSCEPGEIRFGPGCAWVADDRILVRTPEEPLLWVATILGQRWTVATDQQSAFLLHPLAAATRPTLDLQVLDTRGTRQASVTNLQMLPPMAHVVLNEVLANPNGPEPEQEWIELYNDGLAPADLAGAQLVDAGGITVLPDAVVLPGQYALLVNDAFDEESEFDPSPVAGTLVVRVPALGNNGLSNDGEPLSLRDGEGNVWSRFPAAPRPKAGQSVMRVAPKALDGELGAFRRSVAGPTPGAANDLDG